MSLGLGQFRGAWLALALVSALACSSYDPSLLSAPRGRAGQGASRSDGGRSDAGSVAGDAASRDASKPSDSGQGDASKPSDGGPGDAGSGCHHNPKPDELCPNICPETCNGLDDDCDGTIDEDQASTDCTADHSSATCKQGSCLIISCEAGYRDCDHQARTGCEALLDADPNNCGACNHVCTGLHVQSGCSKGQCTVLGCIDGFGDCDGDPFTCETPNGTDTDGDGVYDCVDNCPKDANKREPGTCGCGVSDADSDNDGTPDCNDGCPNDSAKLAPGQCGCGVADDDSDADGTPNCHDGCPADPTKVTVCLSYVPTNFDTTSIDFSAQPSSVLNCGTTIIDTTDPDGAGPLEATISNWCGTPPTPIAQAQNNGPGVVIVPLHGLSVPSGNTLQLIGSRPVIFAVDGDVTVAGIVDASASGTTAGAGGDVSCGSSQGGNGAGDTARNKGASGGGGGGFGTAGGQGGVANTDGCCGGGSGTRNIAGGVAGAKRNGTMLSPLLGGCAGGNAGACTTVGGAGGGAVQVSASGAITVTGTVRANGGLGGTACGANDEGGGSGGGSGGAILLEARTLSTTSATLQANGGAGGKNGNSCGALSCGGTSGGAGSTSSANTGRAGADTEGGGSGGGGGYGRIQTLTR